GRERVAAEVVPVYGPYAVERYIASFNNGPGAVAITGSGQYKIGGEFARMQQMTLDLVVEGQPVQHFDSGLVSASDPFPTIHVSCFLHPGQCYDSVVVVDATPSAVAGLSPPVRLRAGLEDVHPNPFASRASIAYGLERADFVDLTIVDLEGRRVRALANHD